MLHKQHQFFSIVALLLGFGIMAACGDVNDPMMETPGIDPSISDSLEGHSDTFAGPVSWNKSFIFENIAIKVVEQEGSDLGTEREQHLHNQHIYTVIGKATLKQEIEGTTANLTKEQCDDTDKRGMVQSGWLTQFEQWDYKWVSYSYKDGRCRVKEIRKRKTDYTIDVITWLLTFDGIVHKTEHWFGDEQDDLAPDDGGNIGGEVTL